MNTYGPEDNRRANLDAAPPAPPEFQVRKGLSDIVKAREQAAGGGLPGMGGPASLLEAGFVVDQALTALAQVSPNPARYEAFKNALRQAVMEDSQGVPGGAVPAAMPGPMPPPLQFGEAMTGA